MKTRRIFRGADGLNTLLDPVRIQYDNRTGIVDLAAAVNVSVDDTGRVSRTKATKALTATGSHSLYCFDGVTCLCVSGDALSLVEADDSLTPLRNVRVGAPMSFCQVDHRIFYSNGTETGYVDTRDRKSYPWVKGEYIGPDTHRKFIDPPAGSILKHYAGRVLIAQGPALWMTEPLDYTRVDPVRGVIPFEGGGITAVMPAESCVYVSDGRAVHALTGPDLAKDVEKRAVSRSPAISGTDAPVFGRPELLPDGRFYIDTRQRVQGVMWTARDGVYYGGPDGRAINLTRDRLAELPPAVRGAAAIKNNCYLAVLEP